MNIAYVRVSTREQSPDSQLNALKNFAIDKHFVEKVSGISDKRPELEEMLKILRKGDNVYVFKLDRLGRSLKGLIELLNELNKKEVNLVSIKDGIDTSTPIGRFTFNIFGALAEFEREIIRERTLAGLSSAKEKGKILGRKKGITITNKLKSEKAYRLYKEGYS